MKKTLLCIVISLLLSVGISMSAHAYRIDSFRDSSFNRLFKDLKRGPAGFNSPIAVHDLILQVGKPDNFQMILLPGNKNDGGRYKNFGRIISSIKKDLLPAFRGGKNVKTYTMANPAPAPFLLLATGIIGLAIYRKKILSKTIT